MRFLSRLLRRLRRLLDREPYDREGSLTSWHSIWRRKPRRAGSWSFGRRIAAAGPPGSRQPFRPAESAREAWGWTRLETWIQDIRDGLRARGNNPVCAAAAVVSLALGIGANAAIYSIIHAVLLSSLPVKDPSRLVQITTGDWMTNPLWEEIRDQQDVFEGTLAYSPSRFDLAQGGESRFTDGLWVSGRFFDVLGVAAVEGRVFETGDDRRGCGDSGPVAVLSASFRDREFPGPDSVIGKTVYLNRQPFRVIGVTPEWFRGLDRDRKFNIAAPIGCRAIMPGDEKMLEGRSSWWLRILGRLESGITLEQAADRMAVLSLPIFAETTPLDWFAEKPSTAPGNSR